MVPINGDTYGGSFVSVSASPDFTWSYANPGQAKGSGTHLGEWLGIPATGRRFERVDEIYVFQVVNGKLAGALGVEDNLARMKQLGIGVTGPTGQATDPME